MPASALTCEAIVLEPLTMHVSAVMKVRIQYHDPSSSPPGTAFTALLKLFDRRFGTILRIRLNPTSWKSEPHPCTTTTEEAYCDLVRKGDIGPFWQEYEQECRSERTSLSAWHFLDDPWPGGVAQYEAVTWHQRRRFFDRETRAYAKLSELQGKVIPRLFAHVRLSLPQDNIMSCPPDLLQRPDARQYFEVQGLLMEFVDGYELSEIHASPKAPPDTRRWQDIIQTAADKAHEINRHGVIMYDCSIFNVMVDKETHQPFIVDLAQGLNIEEVYEEGEEESSGDAEEARGDCGKSSGCDVVSDDQQSKNEDEWNEPFEPDPEIRYWDYVRMSDNPGAIGAVMKMRLWRDKRVAIAPRWPDYDAVIAAIHRKREQQSSSRGA